MNPSTAQARVIVDELVRCGVVDAVLCPGSRNAALAIALQQADAAGTLRLHVRIDERTAAFLALGLALRSGRPVPVCTTSGTAVANLHPAILEASYSGVPLVALTADRPPELVGTGASQTVVQDGVFGTAVRHSAVVAVARAEEGQQARWRSAVDRAVAAAVGVRPGPVHLNVPFAEPLVPDGDPGWAETLEGRPGARPWTAMPARVPAVAEPLPLDPAAPTLVVAGPGAPQGLRLDGLPVVAEPSSGYWDAGLRAGPWLVGDAGLRPAQVVVAGRPTLHRPVQRLLADPDVAVYAIDDGTPWTDVAATVRGIGSLPATTPVPGWLDRWRVADRIASAALDAALDDHDAPTGLRLARALAAAVPDGSALVLGSSNPVRDMALAAIPRAGTTVVSNRGVAGIDGTVSTATGVALAHGGPTFALLGDLTLLHDTTGLVLGPGEPDPDLTFVVLNDRGGGIFSLLEQGAPAHSASFERVFGTPHTVDVAALCAAVGIAHTAVDDPAKLPEVLGEPAGRMLVEVRAERAGLRAGHARLRAVVDEALTAL
ncbi:2-succinyl-5-enolpyruvyl-6-hydroxy-3-cyclohexene-1-carboxylic-acid synthase [Pseudonocardia sp. N23]|uniref:2-succinyl-5-enolpyruvyl-6-hydroxy-3- cyclohexene-1-carboxylic-acid synthase n=1 Tax=Pseudonocardia sp. N23 TaxID=1987376 RepID=UPI000BFD1DF6|nr:2-succinyl-5-enolpyruvyl-6-hydroxy-3-cyclohexene-1-carboxylic-acid synthase [Pseudonocardia sp. N23]GAY08909.1 2-succinyl-5-enolpyruvyl-6-hydroxy-3-cyclohexene-1-carboxylic-acid synthase [Pseudonocardia sp. N23]